MAVSADERLRKEKAEKCCGPAKIWLQSLRPEAEGINPRQTDLKNVTRLLNVFKIEGCHRLKIQHHVPVLVKDCRTKFAESGLEPEFIHVKNGKKLVYLHGHHRLSVAKIFLPPSDAWWIADVYSAGTFTEAFPTRYGLPDDRTV